MKEILPLKALLNGEESSILTAQQNEIAPISEDDSLSEEQAEYIVMACNSHYALLEATKRARLFTETPISHDGVIADELNSCLDAAIALAEGKGE